MGNFYIGNNLLKAYVGSSQIEKIYTGQILSFQNAVADPTIALVSKTDSSISFTLTNNYTSNDANT